jgi:hypothetical protein
MDPTEEPTVIQFPTIGPQPSKFLLTEIEENILRILETGQPAIVKVFQISKMLSDEAERVSRATAIEVRRQESGY